MSSASLRQPMAGAPLPKPGPQPVPPGRPQVVPPPPERKQPRRRWPWAAAVILAGVGVGLYLNRGNQAPPTTGGGPPVGTAQAQIKVGSLDRKIRLTGTVSAERFSSLMVPALRGSRGSGGLTGGISSRGGGGGSMGMSGGGGSSGGGGRSSSGSSSSSMGSSSGSSSSSSMVNSTSSSMLSSSSSGGASSSSLSSPGGSSTSGSTSSNTAMGSGGGSSSLGAARGSTNRFSDRSSGKGGGGSRGSRGDSGGGDAMGSMGASGMGSTAGSLPGASGRSGGGGGGGGGGPMGPGGDFMMVLLSVAPGGSPVKKGDVVAEFDRQFQLNRIDDYKASVVQAAANTRKLMADQAVQKEAHQQSIRVAKADMEKAKLDLQTLPVVSDIDAERLKLGVEETEARYKQLLNEVKLLEISQASDRRASEIEENQAKMELQRAQNNVDKMLLKAPMDGVVVLQSIRRGMELGQVQQGDQVYPGQTFMQIVDPSSMVVNAWVNQVDADALKIGMKGRVRMDAFAGLELPAHVYSIGAVTVGGRRVNYMKQIPVRLKLDQMDKRVIPDLSASADVVLGTATEVALAPLNSVSRETASGKPFVLLRTPEGWDKREVELGISNGVSVVIKKGLKPGDVVAIEGASMAKTENAKSPS